LAAHQMMRDALSGQSRDGNHAIVRVRVCPHPIQPCAGGLLWEGGTFRHSRMFFSRVIRSTKYACMAMPGVGRDGYSKGDKRFFDRARKDGAGWLSRPGNQAIRQMRQLGDQAPFAGP
jgi:hypothetical protein